MQNIVQEKSFQFALKIISLYKSIQNNALAKQVLRSGTSVGANIEEAIGAYSKREFLTKITIAHKEIRETKYWLELLKQSKYISISNFQDTYTLAEEISKILAKTIITTKNNLKTKS